MKILHIIPALSPVRGGPSQGVIETVKNLQQINGIKASIVTTNENCNGVLDVPLNCWHEYNSVPVMFFSRLSSPVVGIRDFCISTSLTTWLWQHIWKYDIIHIHGLFTYPSTVGMIIARHKKVPYIVSTHGLLREWSMSQKSAKKSIYLNLLEKNNLNHCCCVHFASLQEQVESQKLELKSSSFVVPFGLDIPLPIQKARDKLHKHLNIPLNIPIILFLSRLHEVKGLDYLISALAKISDIDFRFIIAGSGNLEYEEKVKLWVTQSSLKEKTYFVGFVENDFKNVLLQGSDLFTLTSYSESFGIAVLEALGAGTPVLVTRGVALASDIEQNQVGYVVPQEPTAIAKAIEKHLNRSESEREQLSQKARQFVLENYAWDKIAKKIVALYQRILG